MEIIFRGKNTKGEWVEGSLVTTDCCLKYKPHLHTRHWIVVSSFGNGGWFNIRRVKYVKSDTLETLINGEWVSVNEVWPEKQ